MLVAALAMLVPLGPARQCVLLPQQQARAAPRCAAPPSAPRERRAKKRLRAGAGGAKATPKDVAREKHLFFDEVTLSVRGGQGGHGAAFDLPKAGKGAKLARTADGDFALPEGGGRGGSVVLEVDTALQDLLQDLQKQFGMAYVFISHDLAVVRQRTSAAASSAAGSG